METRITKRRQEEAAEVYLDASKAEAELGWKATLDLGRMCADLWRWQNLNPQGYKKDPSKAAFGAFKAPQFQANRPKLSSMSRSDHDDIGKIGSAAFHRQSRDSRSFIASANVTKKNSMNLGANGGGGARKHRLDGGGSGGGGSGGGSGGG